MNALYGTFLGTDSAYFERNFFDILAFSIILWTVTFFFSHRIFLFDRQCFFYSNLYFSFARSFSLSQSLYQFRCAAELHLQRPNKQTNKQTKKIKSSLRKRERGGGSEKNGKNCRKPNRHFIHVPGDMKFIHKRWNWTVWEKEQSQQHASSNINR